MKRSLYSKSSTKCPTAPRSPRRGGRCGRCELGGLDIGPGLVEGGEFALDVVGDGRADKGEDGEKPKLLDADTKTMLEKDNQLRMALQMVRSLPKIAEVHVE